MSFLIPAAIAAGGSLLGGLVKRKQNNQSSQYAYDQARRDYETQQSLLKGKEQRRLDSIDFLQGVAQAHGYNIPDGAFEALRKSGAYTGPTADQAIAPPPKQGFGSVLLGALGSGASTYGSSLLSNAMDKAGKYNSATALLGKRPPSATLPGMLPSSPGADPWESIADYYANLAKLKPGAL